MKLDIIIVDLLLILLVVLPYIIFIYMGSGSQAGIEKKLQQEMKKYNFKAARRGLWNGNYIALDIEQKALLLVQTFGQDPFTTFVDLRKLTGVKCLVDSRRINTGNREEEQLVRVDLQLEFSTGDLQIVNLFDHDLSYRQDYEVQNARKWCLLINDLIISQKSYFGTAA